MFCFFLAAGIEVFCVEIDLGMDAMLDDEIDPLLLSVFIFGY
jgi:hypothetical protein